MPIFCGQIGVRFALQIDYYRRTHFAKKMSRRIVGSPAAHYTITMNICRVTDTQSWRNSRPKNESNRTQSESIALTSKVSRSRSPSYSMYSRQRWGFKESIILERKHVFNPATHKADVSFTKQIDVCKALAKFCRLSKDYNYAAYLFREQSSSFDPIQGEFCAGREHWHIIFRGNVSKPLLREVLISSLTKYKTRDAERIEASKSIDLHFEPIDQSRSTAMYRYNAKATDKLAKTICLYPKRTRTTRNINKFFEPKEKQKLWKEWINETYGGNSSQPKRLLDDDLSDDERATLLRQLEIADELQQIGL